MPNPTPWRPTVRTVTDGQPVNEAVTNRSASDLQRRTEHLKERLDAVMAGQALVLVEQPMADTLAPGAPAYLDNDLVWKPGKAALDMDDLGIPTSLAKTAFVEGIVLYKDSFTMGGIALYGHVEFQAADLLAVIQGTFVPGPLYLSSQAGMLTSTRPTIAVGIATVRGPDANGVYHVFVNPENKSVLEDHVHYKVNLTWTPAGTVNCPEPGDRYIITADGTQLGWLPIGDSAFEHMVKPAGAKFGYNIDMDPVLRRLWPAIPLSSVYVELDKEAVIESGRLVVNASNIWWMDDCIGGAPWTEEYACSPSSSSSSSGSSEADSCLTPTRALTLWMVRMVNKTSDATVTSLEASNDTIELLNCEGLPATTGRLRIRAKFATTQESGSVSPIVLKAFDSDTLQFTTGIVAARVKSLSPYLVITGTDAGTGWKAGDLSFDFLDPNSQREGQPSLISLKNVREASYNDIMYFAFDAGIDSNIIGKIDIGQNTLSGDGTLILYFWVLARTAGTLPALTLTVANMRMPVDCTPVAFPTGTWDTVALPMCSGALTINQYVQVASAGIPVQPGDLLFFKLARSGTDVYAGELGVPSIRYVVAPTV